MYAGVALRVDASRAESTAPARGFPLTPVESATSRLRSVDDVATEAAKQRFEKPQVKTSKAGRKRGFSVYNPLSESANRLSSRLSLSLADYLDVPP